MKQPVRNNQSTKQQTASDPVFSLQFSGFCFRYRSQKEPTLHDIDLAIRPGEKILIVGPSGSGKSTLAHCINGLIPNAFKGRCEGTFRLLGEDALKQGIFEISKQVGTVLQDTDGQFVGLSAGEDIAFSLENDCVPQATMKQRVAEVAKLVDISQHLHKSPQDLSGGQKQRVSTAGVLIDDVDILLFDEPLANLDPQAGTLAIDLIDRLHRQTQKTILIIEHRLEDVLFRSVDRILVIHEGRIIADQPPQQLLAQNLLRQVGIREPLYLTALRYADVPIHEDLHLEHIDKLDLFSQITSNAQEIDKTTDDSDALSSDSRSDGSQTFPTACERLRHWDVSLVSPPPRAMTAPLLEVENLHFYYPQDLRQKPVVQDISFAINKGESVSMVGRNGAGKSTLAKLICGFEKPQQGSLRYDGQDMMGDSIRERAERIGYIMQNPNQMISLPMIFDEVALGLRVRNVPEDEVRERVEQTLRVCGLYPFRNWPISALSFGQKKRLTIASILVLRPQLLILDEPTAGQDFRHYTRIMEFLRELNLEMGLSLLMITHDMHLMLEYTTRAIVISESVKLADDTPANVLTDENLIAAASLKRTSLYDLAVRAQLDDPRGFVQRFIDYDRGVREA